MKMSSFRKKLTAISILFFAITFLSSCGKTEEDVIDGSKNQIETEEKQNDIERYKEFVSSLKEVSILATDLWEIDSTLHEDSVLSLYNEAYESYLITLIDEKTSFDEEMNIDFYSELIAAAAMKDLKEAAVTEIESVEIGGLSGRKFYVDGLIDGVSVTYIFLIQEKDDQYVQVILWSFTENIENNSAYYNELIESIEFHEVKSDAKSGN